MTIAETYYEVLKERVLVEYLMDGISPTPADIEDGIDAISKSLQNETLDRPSTNEFVFSVAPESKSSVKYFNNLYTAITNDLTVGYNEAKQSGEDYTSNYSYSYSTLLGFQKEIEKLETKVGALLNTAKDIEGYSDFIQENFSKNDLIDSASEVFHDLKSSSVTLPFESQNRIPLSKNNSTVTYSAEDRSSMTSEVEASGSDIYSILNEQNLSWLYSISYKTQKIVKVFVQVRPDTTKPVSKITIRSNSGNIGKIVTAEIQYSNDGVNWLYPSGVYSGRLSGTFNYNFSEVIAPYWRVVLIKESSDRVVNGNYYYDFSITGIAFYSISLKTVNNKSEAVYVSSPLIPENEGEYSTASLKVCHYIPDETGIEYEIAGLTENELTEYNEGNITLEDLNFVSIDPINDPTGTYQKSVSFVRNESYFGFNSGILPSESINFLKKELNILALDWMSESEIASEKYILARNLGDNSSIVKINDIDTGWKLEENTYSCNFYIDIEAGVEIDFGETEAVLDGAKVAGEVTLTKGFHKFSTHRDNWQEITVDNYKGETVIMDQRYPYNHKYLIEGVGSQLKDEDTSVEYYGVALIDRIDPNSVYRNRLPYWEQTITRSNLNKLSTLEEKDAEQIYAISKDLDGFWRFCVRVRRNQGLLTNEKFAIISKTEEGERAKSFIVKAKLTSKNASVSPVLKEYIVRLGK